VNKIAKATPYRPRRSAAKRGTEPAFGKVDPQMRRRCEVLRGLLMNEIRARQKVLGGDDALKALARDNILTIGVWIDRMLQQIEADAPIESAGKLRLVEALSHILGTASSSSWLFDGIARSAAAEAEAQVLAEAPKTRAALMRQTKNSHDEERAERLQKAIRTVIQADVKSGKLSVGTARKFSSRRKFADAIADDVQNNFGTRVGASARTIDRALAEMPDILAAGLFRTVQDKGHC
jgi:hypothetical protein